MSTDKRKDFILSTVANYFGISPSDNSIQSLYKVKEINGFLDDGNILVLVSICQSEKNIQLYNELQSNSPDEQCIVFFKIKPEVVTADNIHNNVLVSSMFNSPVSTLYHAIKKIFGPLILNSDVSNKSIDPKVQNLLSELESGLGSYLRKTGDLLDSKQKSSNENLVSILTPADEIQYWTDQANNGNERAACFKEIFERCK